MSTRRLFPLFACLVLLGCAATRFENAPVAADKCVAAAGGRAHGTDGQCNPLRNRIDASHPDQPVILLTFSGGGIRASALAYSVLEELKQQGYTPAHGARRALIDDIAIISSASGGSVTAAWFGLTGPDGLGEFEPEFLARDNMADLAFSAAMPTTWIGFALTGEERTDKVRALFDRQLFKGRHFADFNQPGHPYVVLNATDMASGEGFSLTPSRFDDICSDFDAMPIATGVSASSAVPIVLTPVAFKNWSGKQCPIVELPAWIKVDLDTRKHPAARFLEIEEFKKARYAYDLRRAGGADSQPKEFPIFRERQYLYLLDGGLVDNLGVHGLIDASMSPHAVPILDVGAGTGYSVWQAINSEKIDKLVIIAVNSRSDPPTDIYTSPSRPGLLGMLGAVSSNPIDANSSSLNAQLRVLLDQVKASNLVAPKMKVYDIQIDFDLLDPADPDQAALRDRVKSIATSWTLGDGNLDVVKKAARQLIQHNPCYQRLVLDLGESPALPGNRHDVIAACPQTMDPKD